ncbi:MAG: hypothetical protein ACKOF3_05295, partial [Spartobacteria bacterium]
MKAKNAFGIPCTGKTIQTRLESHCVLDIIALRDFGTPSNDFSHWVFDIDDRFHGSEPTLLKSPPQGAKNAPHTTGCML